MRFLWGRVRISGNAEDATRLLNLLMDLGVPHRELRLSGGRICISIPEMDEKRVLSACDAIGLSLAADARSGISYRLRRYGKRVGLLLGGLLAAAVIFLGSRVVWEVQITGNTTLDRKEVLQMLSTCGLTSGTYLPTINTDEIESRMLLSYGEICWISVNIRGTTASVEILETVRGEEIKTATANLVAARDGRIERIEVYEGQVGVKVGDVVREGDLLVSGVYDKGLLGYRVARARGDVYARTVRTITVEIPLESTEKVYTGREWCEKYVKFFGKRIKVFANNGHRGEECDIIYVDNGVALPDGGMLPVGSETVVYREYQYRRVILEEVEAMERAFDALAESVKTMVTETGAELLSKTVACELDESSFRIVCTLICIENIALERDVEIN